MHSFCPLISDKFIIALLNSAFITTYVKNMITMTHTLQINDGRLIPIVIPTQEQHDEITNIVDRIMESGNEDLYMEELNKKVEQLYMQS